MNLLFVFLLLLSVRLASVFIVQTFYVPDEYWQSLEVAHKLTFGYGYLTWEWTQGIRSYVYPLAIAAIFKLLAVLNLDNARLLILLPRIFQATLSAYSDYRFFVWSGKKKWALFLIIVSYFWFYTGSRTLSNTLETSLTTIALSYFPWYGESVTYLWTASLCCFLRPTAAVVWLPLVFIHLRKSKLSWSELILKRFLLIAFAVGAVCIAIDSYMHGHILVTPYEFFKFNILNNIGYFYGVHTCDWYFTVGLPIVLGVNAVPFVFGTMDLKQSQEVYPVRKHLLFVILFSLCVLSVVDHKEFRFLSILLPLCLYVTAESLTRWSYKASKKSLWVVAGLLLLGNAYPAWYLSTVHQKGNLEVMDKLHDIAVEYRDEQNHTASILFLMPCHSTPYYSHIHQNITMRFLTCEPNLKKEENYKDEADQFYDSPVHWLRSHIPSYPRTAKPSHVVIYEPLAQQINEFLVDYKQLYIIGNTQIKYSTDPEALKRIQSRTGKNILVFERLRTGEENTFNRDEFHKQEEKFTLPKLGKSDEDIIDNHEKIFHDEI